MEQEKTLLRHLRLTREISLERVARDTAINVATLSFGERRVRKLSDEQQQRLAEYFGVPKDALLDDYSKYQAVA